MLRRSAPYIRRHHVALLALQNNNPLARPFSLAVLC
jgi:hypothetical protein